MIKHATSHGMAVLICTVSSSFLVETLKPHFPKVIRQIQYGSANFLKAANIPLHSDVFTVILLACLLAMIWGIFFKLKQQT